MESEAMTQKQMVLDAINQLPETVTIEEIVDELAMLAAIERGIADADAGRTIRHEDVMNLVATWNTK